MLFNTSYDCTDSTEIQMNDIENRITALAIEKSAELRSQFQIREAEMEQDNNSHYLVYRVLGITDEEGKLIDSYQNKGRFLYRFAGDFLEKTALLCFQYKYPNATEKKIPNTIGKNQKPFKLIA